jgi:hypothetical protein
MLPLNTRVLAGHTLEPGHIAAREQLHGGGIVYRVRFLDGRVRMFGSAWVCEAPVVRVGLRVVAVDGVRV